MKLLIVGFVSFVFGLVFGIIVTTVLKYDN